VGKLEVTTTALACDVTIDEDVVGKTPLSKPLLIGVGRHRVTVTCPGASPSTRLVEVAAGESASVSIPIEEPKGPEHAGAPEERSKIPMLVAWSTAGVLAVGAIITGALAFDASSKLKSARDTYPNDRGSLDSKASRVATFSVLSDVLTASTLIAGGIAIYLTISSSSSSEVRVQASARDVRLTATF
jgi:hypothetical protein